MTTSDPISCPKCGAYHGNDWTQCGGACPMACPMMLRSPQQFMSDKTRQFVGPVRKMLAEGINVQALGETTNQVIDGAFRALVGHIDELEMDLAALRTAVALAPPAGSGDVMKHAKRLSVYTAALLRHINPTQVSEDFSLQWHAVHGQIDRLQAALASTPAPTPGGATCPHCGAEIRRDNRTGNMGQCPRCSPFAPPQPGGAVKVKDCKGGSK